MIKVEKSLLQQVPIEELIGWELVKEEHMLDAYKIKYCIKYIREELGNICIR